MIVLVIVWLLCGLIAAGLITRDIGLKVGEVPLAIFVTILGTISLLFVLLSNLDSEKVLIQPRRKKGE